MKKLLQFIILLLSLSASAQYDELNSLTEELGKATTDFKKVMALAKLMSYYRQYEINDSAKFYAEKARVTGEESSDPEAKMAAYNCYGNFSNRNVELKNDTLRKEKAQEYFNKMLQLAIATKDKNNQGWAHFALSYSAANLDREQQMDEALMATSLAVEEPGNDSLYIYSYLRLAIAHGTFRNYRQYYINLDKALVKAAETNNPVWLRSVYRHFRDFYMRLGDADKEWEMIEKLSELTKSNYNHRYRIEDLRAKGYFIRQQAIGQFNYKERLAGTQSEDTYDREKLDRSISYLLKAYDILKTERVAFGSDINLSMLGQNIFWTYFWMRQPEKILEWENSDPFLFETWKKKRGNAYMLNKGAYFFLTNKFDSARSYLDSCIKYKMRDTDLHHVYFLLLLRNGDTDNMIWLLENARQTYRGRNIPELQNALLALDSLYQYKGNYREAETCLKEYVHIADSLVREEFDKKIGLLTVASEEKLLSLQKQKERSVIHRRNSLQYIGITIGISAIFVLLALMGLLTMSSRTIRVLGFFSFLLLFEFLFLVFKKNFEFFTHGEPIRELFIMIILAAVLIPLHHWVEKKVIHYLASHKLAGLREKWRKGFIRKLPVESPTSEKV